MGRTREKPRLNHLDDGRREILYYCPEKRRTRHVSLGRIGELAAERKLLEFREAAERSRLDGDDDAAVKSAKKKVLFRDCWDFYLTEHIRKHKHHEPSAMSCWKHVEPVWADRTVDGIHACYRTWLRNYRDLRLQAGVDESTTIRNEMSCVNAVLNFCAAEHFINPDWSFRTLKTPESKPRKRHLSPEEARLVFEAVRAHRLENKTQPRARRDRLSRTERLLPLILWQAQRITAAQFLVWDRVNFETNMIDWRYHDVKPNRVMRGKRQGLQAMKPLTRAMLKIAYEQRVPPRSYGGKRFDFVLDSPASVDKSLTYVLKTRCGPDFAGVSPHTFRHTMATWMRENGASLQNIAEHLCITFQMAERVYAHITPKVLHRAAVDVEAEVEIGEKCGELYG